MQGSQSASYGVLTHFYSILKNKHITLHCGIPYIQCTAYFYSAPLCTHFLSPRALLLAFRRSDRYRSFFARRSLELLSMNGSLQCGKKYKQITDHILPKSTNSNQGKTGLHAYIAERHLLNFVMNSAVIGSDADHSTSCDLLDKVPPRFRWPWQLCVVQKRRHFLDQLNDVAARQAWISCYWAIVGRTKNIRQNNQNR